MGVLRAERRLALGIAALLVIGLLAIAHPNRGRAAVLVATPKAQAVLGGRWLPTGTGMWLHDLSKAQGGDVDAIVQRAQTTGLSNLFVQTGSTKKGYFGEPSLAALLAATEGTDLKVIAWDFPTLRNPEADARRLAVAARFHCDGCPSVAAVAPDVETASEGTKINASNVIRYYDELRHWLPTSIAILATVPWPSELRVGRYPYASTAARADALMPMTHWYNRDPGRVTSQTMDYLSQFGKPIMPVGQGYDGRLDASYLKADPHPYLSVRSFLLTAQVHGAKSVSLWSWDTSGSHQWDALAGAQRLF